MRNGGVKKRNNVNMKSIVIIISTIVSFTLILTGCTSSVGNVSNVEDNYIESKDSVIQWKNIYQSKDDDWQLYSPYIRNNYLYIKTEMKLSSSMTVILRGFGTASITDTYDKSVPIKYEYDSSTVKMGEYQNITIQVPLSDLDNQRPTTLHCRLATYVGGVQKNIELVFYITW